MDLEKYDIIDISQPVSSRTASFPGDRPFSREVTVTYEQSKVINLTALTMSPHIGTHVDSPIHVQGSIDDTAGSAAGLPLQHFLGPAQVVNIAPFIDEITLASVKPVLDRLPELPARILFRTKEESNCEVWDDKYAYLGVDLVEYMAKRNVQLVGLDTPSMDHATSKTLDAHHALLKGRMVWLENLDLSNASDGSYILIALPLKFTELEASPVRAVLLKEKGST